MVGNIAIASANVDDFLGGLSVEECLESIIRALYDIRFEIVLVNGDNVDVV